MANMLNEKAEHLPLMLKKEHGKYRRQKLLHAKI
jgi:hypothetical protein